MRRLRRTGMRSSRFHLNAVGAALAIVGLAVSAGCASSSSPASVRSSAPTSAPSVSRSGPIPSASVGRSGSAKPTGSVEPAVATVPATSAQVVAADDALAVNLLPLLGHGNVVLSPLSIATALQMTLQGARGETAAQMRSVLHLANNASAADSAKQLAASLAQIPAPTQLSIANTMWLQQGLTLQPDFAKTMSQDYASGFERADFEHSASQATNEINKTISDQTRGKIANLFTAGLLDSSTRLVLANAVYLKAQWSSPFLSADTAPGQFTLANGHSTAVSTMHETAALGYSQGAGYQAVTLPYSDNRLAMTIVLPNGSLPVLEKSLTVQTLAAMVRPGATTGVTLSLPKFSFDSSFDLGKTLQTLGMTDAFTSDADFSGITTESLSISAVIHKAFIDVDEQGTEAAAATGVVMVPLDARVSGQVVDVDRPFLFAITDTTTGAPLFLGTVENPSATG